MRLIACVALVALVACDKRPATPGDSVVSTTDSSGRAPVTTVTGAPAVWRADSIALLTDTGGVGFASVRGVTLDDGAWVLDAGGKAVHRFAPDWSHAGVVGRVGSGPAEYSEPYSLARIGDDVLLYDPGAGRVMRLGPAWTWKGEWPVGRLTGGADVRFYAGGWLMQYARSTNGGAMNFTRFTAAGPGDTLWFPPNPEPDPTAFIQCKVGGGGIRFFSTPYGAPSLLVPTADGSLVGVRGGDYRLVRMRSGGDTAAVIARPVERAPISDAEWESGTADWSAFQAAGQATACEGSLARPAAKAAVRALATDDRGRIWVERVLVDGFAWEIWDAGALVGSLPGVRRDPDVPIEIRGDLLAVTREQPDGGHEVVIYRFAPSPAVR